MGFHRKPESEADFGAQFFVGHDAESRAPFNIRLREKVPAERIAYRTLDNRSMHDVVIAGAGIGLIPIKTAEKNPDLVEVMPPRPDWAAPLWLVTHVDLHRTAKVQSFLTFLKRSAQDWDI